MAAHLSIAGSLHSYDVVYFRARSSDRPSHDRSQLTMEEGLMDLRITCCRLAEWRSVLYPTFGSQEVSHGLSS
jgi:hypothetical protein